MFEGIRYFQTLANEPTAGASILFRAKQSKLVPTIYAGEDHLGIRSIIFRSAEEMTNVRETLGIWWTTVHSRGDFSQLNWTSDVWRYTLIYKFLS